MKIYNLFDKSNSIDVCRLEVITHSPNFKRWGFVMQQIIMQMWIVILRGNNLEIKLVINNNIIYYFIKVSLKSSPNVEMLPSFTRGA